MGVMEKMRKSTGIILWVLIFSFGLLWMLADTNLFDVIQRGPRSLGAVNGETISLDEYNNRTNSYIKRYSRQTGNSATPEMRSYYEQQAWNELITGKLLQQKMDALGITVTDQEVVNMITGENPDPFIRKQFQKEDGTIDRVALQSAIEAPENKQLWVAIESQMRQKMRQRKMSNYIQSSMQVSSYEVEQNYIRNNTTADISYVRFPYADVKESDLAVTDEALRSYYENHQNKYERKKSYRFEYVSFDTSPTKEDSMRTIDEMKGLQKDFAGAEDDSLFLNRYQSTTPYNVKSVEKSQINELYKPVVDLKDGEVSKIIQDEGRIYLLKKLSEADNTVKFIIFSMDIKADPIATIDKRAETADDFSFYAQEDSFTEEAKRRNLETQEAFATKGNNFISGIGQSQQIMTFLKSAEEGKVSKPLELPGQFVVVKVRKVTEAGAQPFEDVKGQIRTVVTNNKRKQKMADRVKKLLSESSNLQALAQASGQKVQSDSSLAMSATTIKGAGREPKVIGAIMGLKQGQQSPPINGTSAVFVVQVDKLQKADVKNLTTAQRQQIRRQLQKEKSSSFMNTWIDRLKKEADIDDNRSRILRG